MARFERRGNWEINVEAIEAVISDRFWDALQNLVEDGFLVESAARRKHQDFLKSDTFQQAVNGATRQYIEVLEHLDKVAVRAV